MFYQVLLNLLLTGRTKLFQTSNMSNTFLKKKVIAHLTESEKMYRKNF